MTTLSRHTFLGTPALPLAGRAAAQKPRARDLGIPFDGEPGPLNAITDVAGVEVGHTTLISGHGRLVVGKGPVRTGATALFPRGKAGRDSVFAAWYSLNGNGEMTGTAWIEESGLLDCPVLLTNTLSVGAVHQAVVEWHRERRRGFASLPVVAETWDGELNDIEGQHVRKEHVYAALDSAAGGPVAEGNVGGGTGMIVHHFKGGIGTASRRLSPAEGGYTVAVLVQANYGSRDLLRIAGVPVGREIPDLLPPRPKPTSGDGSIIALVATDAPLLPHQLKRVARRVSLGVAVMGGRADIGSGDIFLAFSTANPGAGRQRGLAQLRMLPVAAMDPLTRATAHASEEAIVNAMVAAGDMTGVNGNKVYAIPHRRLQEALRKYNRLLERAP